MKKMKQKPSLWWLAVAPLVFILGAGGGTALLMWQVLGSHGGDTFLVPSTQTFAIEEPGTYVLWHDHQIVFEGKSFSKSDGLPDQAIIKLTHQQTEVPMSGTWGATVTSGQHEKKEVGRFTIDQPGSYVLSASGFTEEHVFSFARSGVGRVIWAALLCLLLNLIGWLAPPVILIIVLVMRSRSVKSGSNGK
jgi:hypothetical protein